MAQVPKLLSKEQLSKILGSFCRARGVEKVTEIEAQCVVNWAEDAMVHFGLLRMVLDGELDIDWKDDGPAFGKAKPRTKV